MKFGLTVRMIASMVTALNPALWTLHPFTDFNEPALDNSVENEALVTDLQGIYDNWEVVDTN